MSYIVETESWSTGHLKSKVVGEGGIQADKQLEQADRGKRRVKKDERAEYLSRVECCLENSRAPS